MDRYDRKSIKRQVNLLSCIPVEYNSLRLLSSSSFKGNKKHPANSMVIRSFSLSITPIWKKHNQLILYEEAAVNKLSKDLARL